MKKKVLLTLVALVDGSALGLRDAASVQTVASAMGVRSIEQVAIWLATLAREGLADQKIPTEGGVPIYRPTDAGRDYLAGKKPAKAVEGSAATLAERRVLETLASYGQATTLQIAADLLASNATRYAIHRRLEGLAKRGLVKSTDLGRHIPVLSRYLWEVAK